MVAVSDHALENAGNERLFLFLFLFLFIVLFVVLELVVLVVLGEEFVLFLLVIVIEKVVLFVIPGSGSKVVECGSATSPGHGFLRPC
jgi:hypothetical protein